MALFTGPVMGEPEAATADAWTPERVSSLLAATYALGSRWDAQIGWDAAPRLGPDGTVGPDGDGRELGPTALQVASDAGLPLVAIVPVRDEGGWALRFGVADPATGQVTAVSRAAERWLDADPDDQPSGSVAWAATVLTCRDGWVGDGPVLTLFSPEGTSAVPVHSLAALVAAVPGDRSPYLRSDGVWECPVDGPLGLVAAAETAYTLEEQVTEGWWGDPEAVFEDDSGRFVLIPGLLHPVWSTAGMSEPVVWDIADYLQDVLSEQTAAVLRERRGFASVYADLLTAARFDVPLDKDGRPLLDLPDYIDDEDYDNWYWSAYQHVSTQWLHGGDNFLTPAWFGELYALLHRAGAHADDLATADVAIELALCNESSGDPRDGAVHQVTSLVRALRGTDWVEIVARSTLAEWLVRRAEASDSRLPTPVQRLAAAVLPEFSDVNDRNRGGAHAVASVYVDDEDALDGVTPDPDPDTYGWRAAQTHEWNLLYDEEERPVLWHVSTLPYWLERWLAWQPPQWAATVTGLVDRWAAHPWPHVRRACLANPDMTVATARGLADDPDPDVTAAARAWLVRGLTSGINCTEDDLAALVDHQDPAVRDAVTVRLLHAADSLDPRDAP